MTRLVAFLAAMPLAAQIPPHVSPAKEIAYSAPSEIPNETGLRAHIELRPIRQTEQRLNEAPPLLAFANGYDPGFTWWTSEPDNRLTKAMESYADDLREKFAGVPKEDKDTIGVYPIGNAFPNYWRFYH